MEPIDTSLTEDFWRNVQIVDAIEMLSIFPRKIDLEKARPGDPEGCVYALCIKRVWPEARRVRIWRSTALIEAKNAQGEMIALRYMISSVGQRVLKNFDKGIGELRPCTLLPPSPSKTLEGARERQKQHLEKNKDKIKRQARERWEAKKKGTHVPNRQIKSQGDFLIRNGSGHYRMPFIES